MKRVALLLGIFLMGAILFACAPKVVPVEKSKTQEVTGEQLQVIGKEPWEVKWNEALREARKEGRIVIHSGVSPDTRTFLTKAFEPKFNIKIEWIAGRGGETAQRILTERRAGIYNADLIITGTTTLIIDLKPKDILEPIISQFILPEVLDVKYWYENKYQFADKDNLVLHLGLSPTAGVYANSNLVRKEELQSYKDLLNLKWKERISMNDPTIAGSGLHQFSIMLVGLGEEFLREFARQKPFITRDDRLRADWLAQGKHAISVAGLAIARDMMKAGAPIFQPDMRELAALTQGWGALAFLKNVPHPYTSKIFINWILTREGQEIFSRYNDKQSIRVDVGFEWLHPGDVRQPGVKYYRAGDEDFVLRKEQDIKLAREIFEPLMK